MSQVAGKVAQGYALVEQGRFEQARQLAQRLVAASPSSAETQDLMRLVLQRLNQPRQALYYGQRACELAPGHAGVRYEVGMIHYGLGEFERAEGLFRRAVELDAGFVPARCALLAVLLAQDRLAEGEEVARAGLALDPSHGELNMKMGAVEMETLRMREAFERLAAMRFSQGGGALAHERLVEYQATLANYAGLYGEESGELLTPSRVAALHREAGGLIEPTAPAALPPARLRKQGEPLRVGIASPDLRRHPVAFFIEPFLKHADRSRVELVAFATGPSDGTTERLRPHFARWHDGARMSPVELAGAIRGADVDVLVELAGLTISHVLPALSLRPARVQVTYLGYPNTTGCRFMDGRVVDSITDPPGLSDRLCVERLLRMDPCFLCYQPPADAPARPTRVADRPLTLGCFNRVQKISRQTLAMWGEILRRVPEARLALKDGPLKDGQTRGLILGELERWGVPASRVDAMPMAAEQRDHWLALGACDIALDPYPYHGTTTTCEALLMGTPVVTLAGPTHVCRVGASILTNAGVPELVANSPEEYVAKVVALAGDAARLGRYHAELPGRFRRSVVCDGQGFAERMTGLLEGLVVPS